MATLTETAYLTRKTISIGTIIVTAILVLWFVFRFSTDLWHKIFPPPPPPATVAFGRLPYPTAQNNIATPAGSINFTLETASGGLPATPKNMKVFFMPHLGPSFNTFDKMKALADRIGFPDSPNKPTRVGTTAWHFIDQTTPLRTLDIDEISNSFHLTYNYLSDLSLFNQKNFSSNEEVRSAGRSFFEGIGLFSPDLRTVDPTVTYFMLDSGTFVPTTSLSNADAVGVSFNRSEIDKFPIVSPDPKQGLISVLLSGSSDPKKHVLEGRYFYTAIDLENFATYPVITAADAFEKLKSGQAIYASMPTPAPKEVSIREVYFAYLDPYPPQSYLQPVLVFSDKSGFMAYVPIVSRDYLE